MLPKILSPVSELPIYPYIELYESKLFGVRARIANRNITVANIVHWYYNEGERIENIALDYDLSIAQVHVALAYYHDHRTEIDTQIANEKAWTEKAVLSHPSMLKQALIHG